MKITFLQIEEAFVRCLYGESVRSIARSMAVTEGCLRFHFRKGKSPKEVRRLAFELMHAQQLLESLNDAERAAVDRIVAKRGKPMHSPGNLIKPEIQTPAKRGFSFA